MKKAKVKVSDLSKKDLDRIHQIQINKAKHFLLTCPYTTTVYMALKTKLDIGFILDNRKEIGI